MLLSSLLFKINKNIIWTSFQVFTPSFCRVFHILLLIEKFPPNLACTFHALRLFMCLYCVLCCIFGLCMFKFYVCQCVGLPVINAHTHPRPQQTVLLFVLVESNVWQHVPHGGNMRPAYKFWNASQFYLDLFRSLCLAKNKLLSERLRLDPKKENLNMRLN